MFIELTEYLQCPMQHEGTTYCVLVPHRVEGRDVLAGIVACPTCRREFAIEDGVADLRHPEETGTAPAPAGLESLPPAESVHALLGLEGPGGYVVLVGSAGLLAPGLAVLLEGVHLVRVNPPETEAGSSMASSLRGGRQIPLRSAMARGVVVGREHATAPWLAEGARVLLRGLRMVALAEAVEVTGMEPLASGRGAWVGRRV